MSNEETGKHPDEPGLFEEETKPGKKRKGGRLFWVLLGVMVLFYFWPRGSIVGESILKASRLQEVGLTSSGILRELYHKKGDFIQPGELLARFENPELSKNCQEKKLALEILTHDLERLRKKKEFLEKEKSRKTILFENGAVGLVELELAELELTQAGEELAMKEKGIQALEADLVYLKQRVESLELRAPFSGVLLSDSSQRLGNVIREGEFVLELADPASFYLELPIREGEIEKISVGDPAKIRFRAFPWETFSGEVARIGPATREDVEKVFKIKHVVPCEIRLAEIPQSARYGMRATVAVRPSGGARHGTNPAGSPTKKEEEGEISGEPGNPRG
jgi:multidrug resistance efflux pump